MLTFDLPLFSTCRKNEECSLISENNHCPLSLLSRPPESTLERGKNDGSVSQTRHCSVGNFRLHENLLQSMRYERSFGSFEIAGLKTTRAYFQFLLKLKNGFLFPVDFGSPPHFSAFLVPDCAALHKCSGCGIIAVAETYPHDTLTGHVGCCDFIYRCTVKTCFWRAVQLAGRALWKLIC